MSSEFHGPIGSGCIVCQTPMEYCTCTDPKDEDPGHGWCGQCGRTSDVCICTGYEPEEEP